MVEVALFNDYLGTLTPHGVAERRMLQAWIDSEDPVEFEASGVVFERRRALWDIDHARQEPSGPGEDAPAE